MNVKTAAETTEDAPSADAVRERRCIVTGNVLADSKLLRFVVSPDGQLVPDIANTLPGRGIWVTATRQAVALALRKNLFAKAAKSAIAVHPDLADHVARLLVRRISQDIGLALRSGALWLGFDSVLGAIRSPSPPSLLIEASDGAADGKRKLYGAAHALGLKIETVECLTSDEISLAAGRENVVHAALKSGRLRERLSLDSERLSGLRTVPVGQSESNE